MSSMGTGTLKEQAGDCSFQVMSNLAIPPQPLNLVIILGFLGRKSKCRARWPGIEVVQALGKYLSQG